MSNLDLDTRINRLYEFLYDVNNKNCYEVYKINTKLNEDDYKISFNFKNRMNIIKSISKHKYSPQYNKLLNGYYIFKKYSDSSLNCLLLVSKHNKADNDFNVMYTLSELSARLKTNHIIIPILNIEVNKDEINDIHTKINEFFPEEDKLSLSYVDGFFKFNTLIDYISQANVNFRPIIFQIIHTLAVIRKYHKGFGHNDLNLGSILVILRKNNNVTYKFDDQKYNLDDANVDIKIFNFKKASFDCENKDLHYFYESVKDKLDDDSKQFFKRNNKNKNFDEMLNDEYFSKYNNEMNYRDSSNQNSDDYQQGGELTKPNFYTKNTPFMSNDAKNVHQKRMAENPIREPPVLAEQKVYDTSALKARRAEDTKPPPMHIPLIDQSLNPYMLPYDHVLNTKAPIQKSYNITLANPTGNHSMMSRIYEDMIPIDPGYSNLTVSERMNTLKFMREHMTKFGDMEEMDITGVEDSLLSYIRLMEVSPFGLEHNPYKSLPDRMIVYRGAYPIRYDEHNMLQAAKTSQGTNIRIYQMSVGEYICRERNIPPVNFDLWREIYFYEYIREEILKQKVCPNFVGLICYKIDSKSRIDYNKLKKLKYKDHINQDADIQIEIQIGADNIKDDESLLLDTNKSLVAVTESPNYNILKWTASEYDMWGAVRKMSSTGYHDTNTWLSILFQLTYAMAVLQERRIHINQFSLEHNVYIKDLDPRNSQNKYWKYVSDGFQFYVPNYGYLLLIDSNFKDVDQGNMMALNLTNKPKAVNKIISPIFNSNSPPLTYIEIEDEILLSFKRCFDPNNFNASLITNKVNLPSSEILQLMNSIYSDKSKNMKIKDFLPKYFYQYLNNRVGTPLKKSEIDFVDESRIMRNFTKGEICVYCPLYKYYTVAIYYGHNEDDKIRQGSQVKILTKDNGKTMVKVVPIGRLYKIPQELHIYQDYDPAKKSLGEEEILETYRLQ
jgi:hypothetical protein